MIAKRIASPAARRRWGFWLMTAPLAALLIAAWMTEAPAPALALLAVLVVTPGMLIYWSGLDELAREAQRKAWFWGGQCGLLVGVIIAVAGPPVLRRLGAPVDFAAIPVETAFALGAAATAVPAVIGFGVWWVGFWLSKR